MGDDNRIGSRRMKFRNDDRTIFPKLDFRIDNKIGKAYIQIIQKSKPGKALHEELVSFVDNINEAYHQMILCASSVIEYDEETESYTQNFQLCKQIQEKEGLMCYEIKEF